VLTQKDLNQLQESMLAIVVNRKRQQEADLETVKFEQQLFIANPSMYQEYLKAKKEQEESGNVGVTWAAPESVDEARELMDIFADIESQVKSTKDEDKQANEEFAKQLDLMQLFGGINIDEIGGE